MPVFAQPVASIVEGVQVEWGYSSCSDVKSPNTGESCRSLSQELATVKQKNIKSHSCCFSGAVNTGNVIRRRFSSFSRPCTHPTIPGSAAIINQVDGNALGRSRHFQLFFQVNRNCWI